MANSQHAFHSLADIVKWMSEELAVYFHIPFCKVRCAYCDFVTYAGKSALIPDYLQALRREIHAFAANGGSPLPVCSLYFGGGTPSLLSGVQLGELIRCVRDHFQIEPEAEISMEINPCDVNSQSAAGWRQAGINRASLGMQSAIPGELKAMNRRHNHAQTIKAVRELRGAGISNISLDLIYGFPSQNQNSWLQSLQAVLELQPAHLSLYALSLENGTLLQKMIESGRLTALDDEETAGLYDTAAELLRQSGFEHYEISNWAVDPAHESRHNRQYWLSQPYLGLGAGAHGCLDHLRTRNYEDIETYISKTAQSHTRFPAAAAIEPQSERLEMQDCMMLGLRLLHEGVTPQRFFDRFGQNMEDVFSREIRHLTRKGLIRRDAQGGILLNEADVMIADQAFIEFVD